MPQLHESAAPSTGKLLPLRRTFTKKMHIALDRRRSAQSHLLNHLRTHANSVRSLNEIIEAVYPDNEPDFAEDCIRLSVCKLRRLGFKIKTHWGRGYSLVVYKGGEDYAA